MTSEPVYQPGDVVNGHRLSADGSRWDPVGQTHAVMGDGA
jgi:hypothetical protein